MDYIDAKSAVKLMNESNEFVEYVTKHGYTGIHALVAFSGKVKLDGDEYTEAGISR